MSYNNVKEEDWENNWKKYFKPLVVGDKFLIKPSWESVDNKENRKNLSIITIEVIANEKIHSCIFYCGTCFKCRF